MSRSGQILPSRLSPKENLFLIANALAYLARKRKKVFPDWEKVGK
jgi:hypothetical protein